MDPHTITNNFIEWYKRYFLSYSFIELRIVDQDAPLPEGQTRRFELVNGNLELDVKSSIKGREDELSCYRFVVGTIDNMRQEWFNRIEYARKYYGNFPNKNWEDESWNEFSWGESQVNETTFYITMVK